MNCDIQYIPREQEDIIYNQIKCINNLNNSPEPQSMREAYRLMTKIINAERNALMANLGNTELINAPAPVVAPVVAPPIAEGIPDPILPPEAPLLPIEQPPLPILIDDDEGEGQEGAVPELVPNPFELYQQVDLTQPPLLIAEQLRELAGAIYVETVMEVAEERQRILNLQISIPERNTLVAEQDQKFNEIEQFRELTVNPLVELLTDAFVIPENRKDQFVNEKLIELGFIPPPPQMV